jgi:hypothetical protein
MELPTKDAKEYWEAAQPKLETNGKRIGEVIVLSDNPVLNNKFIPAWSRTSRSN